MLKGHSIPGMDFREYPRTFWGYRGTYPGGCDQSKIGMFSWNLREYDDRPCQACYQGTQGVKSANQTLDFGTSGTQDFKHKAVPNTTVVLNADATQKDKIYSYMFVDCKRMRIRMV